MFDRKEESTQRDVAPLDLYIYIYICLPAFLGGSVLSAQHVHWATYNTAHMGTGRARSRSSYLIHCDALPRVTDSV